MACSDRVVGVDVAMCALDGSGRSYLFCCRLLSSVTVKRRKSWLLAASALVAPLSLGVSEPALAQCVGLGTSTVTCPSGPYCARQGPAAGSGASRG